MKIYDFEGKKNLCGAKVRELRNQHQLSQEELSQKLQLEGIVIDRHCVCRIEKGTRFVTDYELLKLAKIFGVPMEALFTEK